MNYHLMVDDKFIDGFIEDAEKVSYNNCYIFTFNKPAKYVRSTKGVYAPYGSEKLKNIVKKITVADRVYVHWFQEPVMQVINEIDSRVRVYLFFWGGDFLETEVFRKFNFDNLTKQYFKRIELMKKFHNAINPLTYMRMTFNFFLKKIEIKTSDNELLIRTKFLNRLNYFCHWNKFDFEIVYKAYGGAPIFLKFFYKDNFEIYNYKKIPDRIRNRKNEVVIWLGNSATETNNHLDAIFALSRFKDRNMRIMCPLNYGNTKYGDFISCQANHIFKGKWESLRDFLPLKQYTKLLAGADVVVMYHNRCQAGGNIGIAILTGKKVFLKKQSTLFRLMKNYGILVFDANTIKNLSFEEFVKPLTNDQIKSNFEKYSNLFSEEKYFKYMSKLLN